MADSNAIDFLNHKGVRQEKQIEKEIYEIIEKYNGVLSYAQTIGILEIIKNELLNR